MKTSHQRRLPVVGEIQNKRVAGVYVELGMNVAVRAYRKRLFSEGEARKGDGIAAHIHERAAHQLLA